MSFQLSHSEGPVGEEARRPHLRGGHFEARLLVSSTTEIVKETFINVTHICASLHFRYLEQSQVKLTNINVVPFGVWQNVRHQNVAPMATV